MISKQTADAPLLIDTNGHAALLNVSRTTIERWDQSGHLPKPVKIGRRRLWRRAEISAWIEADTPPPPYMGGNAQTAREGGGDMNAKEFIERLRKVKPVQGGYMAACPDWELYDYFKGNPP